MTLPQPQILPVELTDTAPGAVEEQYGAFNDPDVLEPLFASGALPPALRFVLDEPLYTSTLWSVSRWARLQNEERARDGRLDANGPVRVMRRSVTTTPWEPVSYDELSEALL